MTRKEYEEKLNELDGRLYDDDISREEVDKIVKEIDELHEQYAHYDKEILQETLDIVKGWPHVYEHVKRRERKQLYWEGN